MDAVRDAHQAHGFYPPTDSWMVENGLKHYFQAELKRFPDLQAVFEKIERPAAVTPITSRIDPSGSKDAHHSKRESP